MLLLLFYMYICNVIIHINVNNVEIEHQIEEQFAQCINALATRKASLLQDVKQKVDNQSMLIYILSTSTLTYVYIYIYIYMIFVLFD